MDQKDIPAVSTSLGDNLAVMRTLFHADRNNDIIFREFVSGRGTRCFVGYIDGMSNAQIINDYIIKPVMLNTDPAKNGRALVQNHDLKASVSIMDAVEGILGGDAAFFEEGEDQGLVLEAKGFDSRSISEPDTEKTIKGSRESFTEAIRTNTTLIHRALRTEDLCCEFSKIGKINKNLCAVMYLDNVVNKKTLREVKKRLEEIEGDYILGSGMVEQLIEDSPFSLFPSVLSTERPERAANYLAMGRIIILCDNSPYAIVAPVSLAILLDSPEGNSQRWQSGSLARLIRMFAFFCSTILSALYIALVSYHREMIPTQLLSNLVVAAAGIPFPLIVEVLLMEFFFELVREAGLRSPNALGSAMSIVGALILGQSAVEANLVSPVTLIVVALSGLGNIALPDYNLAFGIRVLKFLFILGGTSLGFLGIAIALVLALAMLGNQRSFGISMLSIQTLRWDSTNPVIFQWPLWKQRYRPRDLQAQREQAYPKISRKWTDDGVGME